MSCTSPSDTNRPAPSQPLPAWGVVLVAAALILAAGPVSAAEQEKQGEEHVQAVRTSGQTGQQLRTRLEQALERWCGWLSGYVRPVPESELYTLTPQAGTGPNRYRDVAGNQFAAAAAGYWLAHSKPDPQIARPLYGLIKLALGSHVAVGAIERPEVPKWGATYSVADNWHADLFAATAGMLMPGALAPQEEGQLRTILAWEADRQVEYGISAESRSLPGRWPAGSVGESNAWSTALLQAARTAWPDSPRQAAWRRAAIEYSLNSICLPEDLTCDELVAGRPVREWTKGANFEPGGIQEHHGFYHPGYVGWPLAYQAFAAVMDEPLPPERRNPDVYLRHWKRVFDRLKQGTFANGRFIHCAGDDWNAYGYGNDHILPIAIFAAVRFGDPDAARLAHEWLALIEHAQRLTGGSIQGARLARLERCYHNDFAWYEAISGASLAHALWVMDRLDTSQMPPPSSEEEYNARNVGTYHEPNARLVWHRDRHRWASCSWRSAFGRWQAIVQPVGLPHLLKFNHNSVGMIEAAGTVPAMHLHSFRIETLPGGGFWSVGTIDRLRRTDGPQNFLVRQHQALVVLPEGRSLWVDQCQALAEIELLRTGGLGLRLAADVFNEGRVRLSIAGEEKTFAQHPDRDTWHDLKTQSLVIEKLLAIHALAGEETFQLLQKRRRDPQHRESPYAHDRFAVEESLLSHELYFGPPECRIRETVAAGTFFRNIVLVIYCDPDKVPEQPTAVVSGRPPCLAIDLPEVRRTVAINFSDVPQRVDAAAGRITAAPQSVTITPHHALP